MKIFIAQQNYHIGNFEANSAKIIKAINEAKNDGGDLIVFSELAICGYPPRDFLEFEDFILECQKSIDNIAQYADGIGVLIGAPSKNPVLDGKDLFNSAYLFYDKKVQNTVHKTLLPTYDVFDEYRYFEPANEWHVMHFKGKKLAVTICEDIWNLGDNPLYRICPMDQLMAQQPDVMINLSASPFDYTHAESRIQMVSRNCKKYHLPMVYCNGVGSQTEIVFDGGSIVMDETGNMIKEFPYFSEHLDFITISENNKIENKPIKLDSNLSIFEFPKTLAATKNMNRIFDALVMGIKDYFFKMNFKKAIVASSGGIDSAVVLALACEALGAENVRALLMPSQYSTPHSVDDAVKLSQNLNNPYDILSIKEAYDTMLTALKPVFNNLPFNVAEENLQSRIRGNYVMALANKFNYILLNTSNKSELATGYGTLYGDMAGGLGVLGDLYKLQVYELAKYINKDQEIIPQNILNKAPSAELRPNQKDADSLPDYSLLDPILYQYIELKQGPKEIIALGFEATLVERILKMVNINEYKRNQFCPIIRVSPKSFGVGRRVPIVGKYLS